MGLYPPFVRASEDWRTWSSVWDTVRQMVWEGQMSGCTEPKLARNEKAGQRTDYFLQGHTDRWPLNVKLCSTPLKQRSTNQSRKMSGHKRSRSVGGSGNCFRWGNWAASTDYLRHIVCDSALFCQELRRRVPRTRVWGQTRQPVSCSRACHAKPGRRLVGGLGLGDETEGRVECRE